MYIYIYIYIEKRCIYIYIYIYIYILKKKMYIYIYIYIRYLCFTDDAGLVTHTEKELQRISSCFTEAAQLFGLEVILKNTEILHQPASRKEYRHLYISIGITKLKVVHPRTEGAPPRQMPRSTKENRQQVSKGKQCI